MSQPVNKSAPSTPGAKTKPARKRAKTSILSIAYPDACLRADKKLGGR
jgi:hypothetical protein